MDVFPKWVARGWGRVCVLGTWDDLFGDRWLSLGGDDLMKW
jgi:hypothetical protein